MPLGENLSEQIHPRRDGPRRLCRLLDEEAEFADIEGELSPTVVAALHRDGLLKIWVPEKLGGAELGPLQSLEVLENLSYGDASAGWVAMAANLSIGTAGAYLSDHAVAELWGEGRQPVIAGQGTRPGTARIVDGGLSLSGAWSFGSGLKHSTHVHSLGIIEETGEPRIFVTPIEAVNLIDNWDVMGLRGTGSIDYTMDERVRARRVEPLRRHHRARARRQPVRARHHRVRRHLPPRLGHGCRPAPARRVGRPGARQGRPPGAQADNAAFQQGYAQAEAKFRAARALVVESLTDLSKSLYAGDGISVRQHTMVRLALAHITKTLHDDGQLRVPRRRHHRAAPRHDPAAVPRRARGHPARDLGPAVSGRPAAES